MDSIDRYPTAQEAVPSCALDRQGLAEQRLRHQALAPTVTRTARSATQLVIEFGPGYDRQTLEDMLAVERRCCPFFVFDFDRRRRRLEIGVRAADQLPALEAIADALAGT